MINQTKEYFQKGNYSDALKLIDKLQGEDMLEGLIIKSRIYQQIGEFNKGLEIGNLALQKCQEHQNYLLELGALSAIAYNYYRLGQFDKGIEIFRQGEEILRKLSIEEQEEGKEWIGLFRHIQGTIYIFKWELELALTFLQKSLEIREQLDNKKDMSDTLNNIGEIHRIKGEYSLALDYYKQSLNIDQEFDSNYGIAITMENIGMINFNMGEHNKAYQHYKQSLDIVKEFDNKYLISRYLFNLIRIALELNMSEEAKGYLNDLTELSQTSSSELIHTRKELGEALILKYSKRLKEKMKAQEILEELSDQEDLEFELKVVAMTHLCEILLLELRVFENEEAFHEVYTLVNRLNTLGKNHKIYTLIVDSLLLLAKLNLIKGDIDLVEEPLSQAQLYATEKGLTRHLERVKSEMDKFNEEVSMWKSLAQKSAPMTDKIDKIDVEDYLEFIRQIVDL